MHPRAPGELEILLIEKELLGETAELAEHVGADRAGGAACIGDPLRLNERVGRIAVPAGPRQPADVDDVAARVEDLWPLEQTKAGLDDADIRLFEGPRERIDRTRLHDRVRVDEDEHLRSG